MRKYKAIWDVIVHIGLIVVAVLLFKQCERNEVLQTQYEQVNAWLDETNLIVQDQSAKNQQLLVQKRKDFLEIKGLTGDKKELQDLLKKERKAHSATIARINVAMTDTITKLVEVLRVDTVEGELWPTYQAMLEDEYRKAGLTMNKDTAIIDLQLQAKMSYWYTYEREGGLFSKKVPKVHATIDNPYINWESVESVAMKQKPPKFNWGVTLGVGVNTELQPTIGLVFGPSYRVRDF